ncbi:MAG: fibrillarin-like rRNA/tRNA 2'-O-methyltransferase, partial [Candidatus Micrarchaeota archaeon]
AALAKGLKELPIHPGDKVLYLGASSGTTPSHVSDIVGEHGIVFCVEFAPRSMRDLINVCNARPNMLPILADARQPQEYADIEKADVIYQDVAQPDQAEIFVANAKMFLKEDGEGLLCVKSQSIDVTQNPKKTYEQLIAKLESEGFQILEAFALDPYDKDHLFVRAKMK